MNLDTIPLQASSSFRDDVLLCFLPFNAICKSLVAVPVRAGECSTKPEPRLISGGSPGPVSVILAVCSTRCSQGGYCCSEDTSSSSSGLCSCFFFQVTGLKPTSGWLRLWLSMPFFPGKTTSVTGVFQDSPAGKIPELHRRTN